MFKKEFLKPMGPFYTDAVLDALYPDDPPDLRWVITDRRIPREHWIRIGADFLGNNLLPLLYELGIESDGSIADALIGYALRIAYEKSSEASHWEEASIITRDTLNEIYDELLFKIRMVLCRTESTLRYNSMMIL